MARWIVILLLSVSTANNLKTLHLFTMRGGVLTEVAFYQARVITMYKFHNQLGSMTSVGIPSSGS